MKCIEKIVKWFEKPQKCESEVGVVFDEGGVVVPVSNGDYEIRDFSGSIRFYGKHCRVENASFNVHIRNSRLLAAGHPFFKTPHANTIEWLDGTVVEGDLCFCSVWHNGIFNGSSLSMTSDGEFCGGAFNGESLSCYIWHGGTFNCGVLRCHTWKGGDFFKGLFYGHWEKGTFHDGEFHGLWECGLFLGGVFEDGRWYDGFHQNGTFKGKWYGGEWKSGRWEGDCRVGDGVKPDGVSSF